ncbi:MAG: hypothetical protein GWO24_03310, partial [Akkermansiaceae bacterium]|nr:hypothetical protein [Akkermansiaceae bacterium]
MISPVRTVLALLCLSTGTAPAQYTRIEAPVGPGGAEVTLHLYLFDPRRTTIKVISQGEPGTRAYRSLDAAMRAQKCEAGCNGGFLDAQGNPLGLVIADGRRFGKPASGTGPTAGVFYLEGAQPQLQRATAFFSKGNTQVRQLLQAGPFLVEGGKTVDGLNSRRTARRTFVL